MFSHVKTPKLRLFGPIKTPFVWNFEKESLLFENNCFSKEEDIFYLNPKEGSLIFFDCDLSVDYQKLHKLKKALFCGPASLMFFGHS